MFQVNVIYNKDLVEIVFDCLTIEEASQVRYRKINKWFDRKMSQGVDPAEIFDLLEVEIANQEGS